MSKKYTPHDLLEIEKSTVGHYEQNAETFWQGTHDHDVSQNIQALLQALPEGKTLNILDFGCGPGRDLCTFTSLGHTPVGLDGSPRFCQMARELSGCPVLHQSFLELQLPENHFDGIFANASLFHIPRQALTRVLRQLRSSLKMGGVLFSSTPRGNTEDWQGERYGHYMEYEDLSGFLERSGFTIINHFYRPEGLPRNQQPWLAIVSLKE